MKPRVAIIGGGWSGLAAGVTLAAAGVRATLFEGAPALGGRARRVNFQGIALDNGQHLLLGAYDTSLDLLRRVHGARPEGEFLVRRPLAVVRPGGLQLRSRALPAPLHLLSGLLAARGIRFADRAAAIRFFLRMKLTGFSAPAPLTVAELLRHEPRALVEQLWDPLCVAALNTPIHAASADVFLNVLARALDGSRAASDFLLPRVDLEALFPQPAARLLAAAGSDVRTASTVTAVAADSTGGHRLQLRAGTETFSHVVCAVAPQHFNRLTADLPALLDLRELIDRYTYEPIATLYLQCTAAPALEQPMLQLDGNPGQWLFDRGALGGRSGLYAVVISAAARGIGQEQLGADVLRQLRRSWPAWPEPQWMKLITEKRATFACTPGLVRPGGGRVVPGFYLAGDYTEARLPATLETAAASGVQAAHALLGDL